jgi:hypothetical protein
MVLILVMTSIISRARFADGAHQPAGLQDALADGQIPISLTCTISVDIMYDFQAA